MREVTRISLICLLAAVFANCQDIVEKKCNLACDQFVSCTEKTLKLTLSNEAKRSGHISCMDGCTTHNSDILKCFDEEPTSCSGFGNCVLQIGTLE
ncbi:Cys-rich protein [Leptospira ognonensis]|uniref:Cys-rich protein n=1 Tax=Leptospira ognonensis TaxID=2484945 RepID=A0A4V3JSE7_9LEPT|nr:Cys-rich protein [Leptospira ognonensis]TGL63830.1 Cys-rich protein [Leptospira ognonensis]